MVEPGMRAVAGLAVGELSLWPLGAPDCLLGWPATRPPGSRCRVAAWLALPRGRLARPAAWPPGS
ncbi:hypothetical protein, partial [Allorhizocola rhizosphaerae]|uniref:hypothetical protein n=1 Tax=Allorhizocola rhizosphaerae TaxID=1872709 RepID=UPI001B8B04D2